ncbi:MFS transporter [Micromonospora sp. CPCC 206061]|uniref:MFS transporter n=1 Tax=Micromonospora sp. CPCC 206061 TaxID=3122410 RepID=UPI002FF13DFA
MTCRAAVLRTRQPRSRVPTPVRTAAAVALLGNSSDTFVLFLLLWVAQPQGWSPVQTALVVLTLRLPILISGVLIGRCIDRWGARPLILLDTAMRAGLLLVLAASVRSGTVPLAAVLVLGGLASLSSPATYAGVRWLVPRTTPQNQLPRANATVAVGDQMPLLVGTALVGPAMALSGVRGSLLVAAAMVVAAFLLALRLPTPAPGAAVRSIAPRSGRPPAWPARVTAIIALSTVYYLVYGPFETASPGFVRDHLGASEGTYSLLWAMFGAGALLSLSVAPVLARHRPGLVNGGGALVWGLTMLPLATVDSAFAAAVIFLVGGLLWGPYTTIETGALQRWVPPQRHGTVFAVQRSLLATATPVGAAFGALALHTFSPGTVLAVSSACCAAAGAAALLNPDLRRAR